MGAIIVWVFFFFIPYGVAFVVGRRKGRRGWAWGFLGWLGAILMWRLADLTVPEEQRTLKKASKHYAKGLAAAERSAERARSRQVLGRYGGVVLYEDGLVTPHGTCELTPEIKASVETEGTLQQYATSRLTATRMLTLGVFALAAPKHKRRTVDTRKLYLYIETPEFSSIVPCDPNASTRVRSLAVEITNAGRRAGQLQEMRTQRITAAERALEAVRAKEPPALPVATP
jgi:hypothetical protein